jgi:hypothetical protein
MRPNLPAPVAMANWRKTGARVISLKRRVGASVVVSPLGETTDATGASQLFQLVRRSQSKTAARWSIVLDTLRYGIHQGRSAQLGPSTNMLADLAAKGPS